ncbi:MAG: hypothetical protein ACQERP_08880 [Pseudomonadota bacterium]
MIGKKKLAIISTYGELCGIAGYTHWLKKQLEEDYEIEVLSLEQKYLKRSSKNGVKSGDELIKKIADSLSNFDAVNIQFEPGTLAPDLKLALKRFKRLVSASPSLAVTFHTVERDLGFRYTPILKTLAKGKPRSAFHELRKLHADRVWDSFYKTVKKAQSHKKVSVVVHTKREKDFFEIDYNFDNVYDHPLSFLKETDVEEVKKTTSRNNFKNISGLDGDVKFIGLFGFLAPYKGVMTAIDALSLLPENYHLLLFGGIHPNEMKKGQLSDAYLEKINSGIYRVMEKDSLRKHTKLEKNIINQVSIRDGSTLMDLSLVEPRVHFMGALDDMDFLRGMEVCDYVVTPYAEVGQSGSGPMTMALEMGAKLLTSRTKLTEQMRRYYPNSFIDFEVGNHVQLAEYINRDHAIVAGELDYSWVTNKEIYKNALGL